LKGLATAALILTNIGMIQENWRVICISVPALSANVVIVVVHLYLQKQESLIGLVVPFSGVPKEEKTLATTNPIRLR